MKEVKCVYCENINFERIEIRSCEFVKCKKCKALYESKENILNELEIQEKFRESIGE